ncbi:MAG: cation diffusion facilitator family transporter [Deltaproteobacteria bacterium]
MEDASTEVPLARRPSAESLNAAARARGVRRVLLLTLGLNALVAALKLAFGSLTHTLSLQADGFHSLTDGGNNVLGLLGIWWSTRPPDSKHPYGHEKMEVLAASAIGASLILVAWGLVGGAIDRLRHGAAEMPELNWGTVAVLLGTLVINVGVARYEARAARQLESTLLASDAAHTLSDVLVTLGVLITVIVVQLGYPWVDSLATCAIAVFILVTGVQVISHNVDYLMDSAQVDEAKIRAIVCRVPGIASAHKVRTRGTPGMIRIDLHIQIAPHLNVRHAHEVTHWAIDALKREVSGVRDVIVHTEPAAEGIAYPELPDRMQNCMQAEAPRS